MPGRIPFIRPFVLCTTLVAILTVAFIIFLDAQGASRFTSDALRQFRLHHSRPPHAPSSGPSQAPPPIGQNNQGPSHASSAHTSWQWDYKKHARNYGLSEEQCSAAFPLLYREVDRAVQYRRERAGNISLDELDVGWRGDGIVRAMVRDNLLYIIDAHGVQDANHRPRSLAVLHALHRAVTAYDGVLPPVEFTFTDHDSALTREDGNQTTWAFSRLAKQESLWLMPEFGNWAWPDVGLRSYTELQAILDDGEDEFLDKIPRLVWRGSLAVGTGHDARAGLVEHSGDQPWSDVQTIDWANATEIAAKLLTMEDHCGYMFTAQTEGNTYSGRLKYLLNCHSVLLSHELRWIEHFHHLLVPAGPARNYVRLQRDFRDLPAAMAHLLQPARTATAAEAIADRARATFRERYLTPAAEACYWRALIRGWASVQGFRPQIWVDGVEEDDWRGGRRSKRRPRGTPFESFVIMEQTEWAIPAKGRHVCVD